VTPLRPRVKRRAEIGTGPAESQGLNPYSSLLYLLLILCSSLQHFQWLLNHQNPNLDQIVLETAKKATAAAANNGKSRRKLRTQKQWMLVLKTAK
jgi:hypothetical protein